MIPDEKTIQGIWDKYSFPFQKQIHAEMVANVALQIARKCKEHGAAVQIDEHLLEASALLHDIDKNIEKLPGEIHPDAGVRILKKEGMDEIAEVIRTHPLHMILREDTAPKTIEQKILFLADKMTKFKFIGVDKRFELWEKEDCQEAKEVLKRSYPKVIALRDEVFKYAGITEEELAKLAG